MINDDTHDANPRRGSGIAAEPGGLRGFWSLIVTQFQGAFSDNVVKNLVVFVALFATGNEAMSAADKNHFGESIGALFSLPFILFSMAGGFLADKFTKTPVLFACEK